MKRTLIALILILVAAACYAETHTIVLVSKVEKRDAQFVIRNTETGEQGASVVYCTDEIARQDVRTSFDVIQCCDSNGLNVTSFTVSATELRARVNGRVYSTDGVGILMDGESFGSRVEFTRTTFGVVAAGAVVAGFEVVWPTNANLVDAVYEACVTLTATAL